MTVLADYQFIESGPVIIGDPPAENPFRRDFNTGGRLGGYTAFLTLMVSGLNLGKGARVLINDREVGTIFPVSLTVTVPNLPVAVNDTSWRTQTISFKSDILSSGDDADANQLTIDAVPRANPQPNDLFENFVISNVLCFFRQDSE